jgi:hypothetical protein
MRQSLNVPATTFKTIFRERFAPQFVTALLRTCGVRRRRPPLLSAFELIAALIFHVVAGPGKLAAHVKLVTGKTTTDGALSQRRALLPMEVFDGLLRAALQPKANPKQHPDAFYQGLRLCGLAG